MEYLEFIKKKKHRIKDNGFEIQGNEINNLLFPFQKFIVKKAIQKGTYGIFADCGLGKTFIQLEWARIISQYENKPILILAPLGVSFQTINEAKKLNIEVQRITENLNPENKIYISNYENLHKIDVDNFIGVVLDESSILKNYSGAYKKLILEVFAKHRYKLCCTATPSPNDHMEIGNHAEFLNIMPSKEMLSRFFINDKMHFGSYRLKKHGIKDFWEWVSSWAISISKPSDIGFEDDGFILPPLNIMERQIQVENIEGIEQLFRETNVNATTFHKELRLTKIERLNLVKEIAENSDENFIIWVAQNEEGDYLKKILPSATEVRGSEPTETKEKKLLAFANNEYRILITKKKIAQFGMNFQNCNNQIHASLDFSFESLYQSIRRSYRFMQKKPVNIYLITTNTMGNVMKAIKEKENMYHEMKTEMVKATSDTYLNKQDDLNLKLDYKSNMISNDLFTIYNGDCIEEIRNIADNSIDLSIFSPPFSSLYIYSDSIRDMGNSKDDEEFFKQFEFLVPELMRVTRPNRLIAVHCKNLVNYINQHGKSGLRDFRGDIIRLFTKHDFSYHSEITIWKDPVTEMYRTKAHGLLYKQLRKDSSFSRMGLPEYVLIFRKWANETTLNLVHDINWKTKENFPLETWQKWASPVWFDIEQTNVLNKELARENKDEKHICPLQLDVIERLISLYSNEGEIILDPFAGIGSVGVKAIQMKRKFLGIELKVGYFNQMRKYLDNELIKNNQNKLSFAI